ESAIFTEQRKNCHGLIYATAYVAAQVQDQPTHAPQLSESLRSFISDMPRQETVDLQVPNVFSEKSMGYRIALLLLNLAGAGHVFAAHVGVLVAKRLDHLRHSALQIRSTGKFSVIPVFPPPPSTKSISAHVVAIY